MQVDEVVSALIAHCDMSARGISAELGKSQNWATMAASGGRIPKLDTLADIADVAGCDVAIIDRATGERVATVDPPRRSEI